MGKIVTFGEIMLRLAPNGFYRFFQNDQMQATFGGAEANVAVSLANFGEETEFVSKVPEHAIGQAAINSLRYFGVGTSFIKRGGERLGIYYLEKGANQRGSVCIYDRKHSSISEATLSDFNWEQMFKGAEWFHFSGITPALSKNMFDVCLEACKKAKEMGVKVSCDLNYRGKLWSKEAANKAMSILAPYFDVCIANEEDASDVFNIKAKDTEITNGKLNKDGYKDVAKQLRDRFGFKYVAITLRTSISATVNNWAALLYDGDNYFFSKEYHIDSIVDRVGGGDSFSAGLIYALKNNYSNQDIIEFAVAASALKHSVEGDFNRIDINEVKKLASGNGSGRVQR